MNEINQKKKTSEERKQASSHVIDIFSLFFPSLKKKSIVYEIALLFFLKSNVNVRFMERFEFMDDFIDTFNR